MVVELSTGPGSAVTAGDDDAAQMDCRASAFGHVQERQRQIARLDEGAGATCCGVERCFWLDQGATRLKYEPRYGLTPFAAWRAHVTRER